MTPRLKHDGAVTLAAGARVVCKVAREGHQGPEEKP